MMATLLPALTELQSASQWVCWKYEPNGKGELTKVPYNPRGYKASSTNKSSWSSYQQAIAAYSKGGYDGTGYVLLEGSGIVGGDLDGCIDQDGTIAAWAIHVVKLVNTYTEVSPSRTGLRFIARGAIPAALKQDLTKSGIEKLEGIEKAPGIEMYEHGRYLTITGNHLPGTPDTIEERSEQLLEVFNQYKKVTPTKNNHPQATQPLDLSDSELLNKMFASKVGLEIQSLWNGTHGLDDESRADYALCTHLAFWTGKDVTRMEYLFNQSSLAYREKWYERADYRQRTIEAAIEACGETYSPGKSYEAINTAILEAIEKDDVKPIYALASDIAQLDKEKQLLIKNLLDKNKRRLKLDMRGFEALKKEAIAKQEIETRKAYESLDSIYAATKHGMVYYTQKDDEITISNFSAEIATETLIDDGVEAIRHYELVTRLFGRKKCFAVPALDFEKGEWIDKELGARARVTVGKTMKAHLMAAIRDTSNPSEEICYAHTGWRKIDESMVYLHAGGAVSQVSQLSQIENQQLDSTTNGLVEPSERESESSESTESSKYIRTSLKNTLSHYLLPETRREDVKKYVQASLRILDITSDGITVPLYCSLWRAPLGRVDYGVHLAGPSGRGKSELCALIQQHDGPTMDARHLPASWLSTENTLEMDMFQCKDAVLVVDDFKPLGSKHDQDRLHAKADGVFRRIGNNTARGRLDGKLQKRPERPPRCLVISTGEDTPRGESLKARGFPLFMGEAITSVGTVAQRRLTACQSDASNGLYAACKSAYVAWLAPRIEKIQATMRDDIASIRERLVIAGHARSGSNVASALLGIQCFLQFAVEMEALSQEEAETLFKRCENALLVVASELAQENREDRPSEQFIRLLAAAINSGRAHLVNVSDEKEYPPSSEKAGWIEEDNIYLLPESSYKIVCAMGASIRDEITTTERTLRKFLNQDKKLASTDLDKKRKTITVRVPRRIDEKQPDTLHMKVSTLFPSDDPDQDSAKSEVCANSETDIPPSQRVDSVDSPDSAQSEVAPENVPDLSQVNSKTMSESSKLVDSLIPVEKSEEIFARSHLVRERIII